MRKSVLAVLLPFLPLTAGAQVYADFHTTRGTFTCELDPGATPRTVANFVTLAEGTRPWLDERTGKVSNTSPAQPFYDGLTFHRVIDQGDFRIVQTGSKTGDGNDGPGYTFPDEYDELEPESYDHSAPYLLSMANAGLNDNGSQFFISGAANAAFDGKYTVFGKVVSGQAVVEKILNVATDANDMPLDTVVIQRVVIRRVGEEAEKFTGLDASLPVVTAPPFESELAATGTTLKFDQPAQSLARVWMSDDDGQSWEDCGHRYIGPGEPERTFVNLDLAEAGADVRFRVELTKYPDDALMPGQLTDKQLYLENESGDYLFRFGGRDGATYLIVLPTGDTLSGKIQQVSYEADGYGATLVVDTGADGTFRYRLAAAGRSRSGTLTGAQTGSFHNFLFGWLQYEGQGDFSLSTPGE